MLPYPKSRAAPINSRNCEVSSRTHACLTLPRRSPNRSANLSLGHTFKVSQQHTCLCHPLLRPARFGRWPLSRVRHRAAASPTSSPCSWAASSCQSCARTTAAASNVQSRLARDGGQPRERAPELHQNRPARRQTCKKTSCQTLPPSLRSFNIRRMRQTGLGVSDHNRLPGHFRPARHACRQVVYQKSVKVPLAPESSLAIPLSEATPRPDAAAQCTLGGGVNAHPGMAAAVRFVCSDSWWSAVLIWRRRYRHRPFCKSRSAEPDKTHHPTLCASFSPSFRRARIDRQIFRAHGVRW